MVLDSDAVNHTDLKKRFSAFETLVFGVDPKPDLIIIDPFYGFDGLDKNGITHFETINKIMTNIRHLTRKLGCGIILVLGAREGETIPLGSQAFFHAANVAEFLKFENPGIRGGRRVLTQEKNLHALEHRLPRLWETRANGLLWIDQGTFAGLTLRQKLERSLFVLLHGQRRPRSFLKACMKAQGIILSPQTWTRAMKSVGVQEVGDPVMRGSVQADSWLTIPRGTPPPEGLSLFGN